MISKVIFPVLCVFSIAFQGVSFAVTTKEVFARYPNKYFVETGSYRGDGIQMALDAGSFEKVHSIELSPKYYKISASRFINQYPKVQVWFGDSATKLKEILDTLDAPATFWLDGHCSMEDTAKGNTMTPLMQELEAIKNHKIKNHTIMIDDIRQFETKDFDFLTKKEIIAKLMEINPNYVIVYEDGYVKNDVLIAYIKK